MQEKIKFKNLQGLRAIAVLTVIGFHFGLPIRGGFLGVDLFFLISGFIIPWTLMREFDETGSINLRGFYRRRIHRLFPASIITILITATIALLISTPEISLVSAKTSISALFISANYLIASLGNNYFSPAAELNPLLHYWSLAVEEQVYLLVALLIGITQIERVRRKVSSRTYLLVFALVTLSSLIFWLKPTSSWQDASIFLNYYSTLIRLWEFSFGFIILLGYRRYGVRSNSLMGFVDLFAISICGYLLLFTTGNTFQANIHTSVFLLIAGYFIYPADGNIWSQRLLSSKLFQFLGDRSYSLYLIHWPVFVYLKEIGFIGKRLLVVALFVTFLLSFISFKYVETRFRVGSKKNLIAITCAFLVATLFSVAALFISSHRVDSYQSDLTAKEKYIGEIGHQSFFDYLESKMYPCLPEAIRQNATNEGYLRCWQSKESPKQDLVLFGDSHSEHLFPGFAAEFPQLNVVYFDALGAPTNPSPQAKRIIMYVLENQDIKYVVLSTYWNNRGIDIPGLRKLLSELHSSGKFVYLTSDVPGFQGDPFNCKYGIHPSRFATNACTSSFNTQPQITESNVSRLRHVISGISNTKILNTTSPFCNAELTSCSMVHGGEILYRDPNHLNALGSIFLIKSLLENGELSDVR